MGRPPEDDSERAFARSLGITRDKLRTLEARALRKMRRAYLERYGGTPRSALESHSRDPQDVTTMYAMGRAKKG